MRRFLILCAFTVLAGSIYVYPDVRFIAEEAGDFKGITLTGTADEAYYLSKLNDVYKGDYRMASAGLYEHRNDPWLVPPYFETLIGLTGKALELPVQYLDIVLSFLFPVIIFWLIYALVYYLSDSRQLGMLGACGMLFGYALFTGSRDIFINIMSFKYSEPLWFLRPFSPQLIYIPFIISLILIFLFIDTRKKWRLVLIALSIASLNYLHLYLWAFLFSGLTVWLVVSIFQRNQVVWKNIIIILIFTIFLAIPYWINHYRVSLFPSYEFLEKNFGMEYSRRPILPLSYILASSMILILNKKRSPPKVFYFLLSFLAGGILCLNQQIITGKIMETVHFSNYTNKTFLIIAFISSLNKVRLTGNISERLPEKLKRRIITTIFSSVMIFLAISGFAQQNNYYHKVKGVYSEFQSLRCPIDWLNNNTAKEDVVLTDSIKFGSFIFVRNMLLYTRNYYYLSIDCASLISREEKENRILLAMRFFKYPLWEAESVFNFSNCIIFLGMSSRYNLVKNAGEYAAGLKSRYVYFMSKDGIELLRNYKVDYVLVGKKDHLFNAIEREYPDLAKVFDNANYKIFRLRRI